MQENNSYNCKKILDSIKKHYKLKTYGDLARFLGVKEGTLYSWNARNSIGDLSAILDKCKGISRTWLNSGKGEMFVAGPAPTYEPEKPTGPIDITALAGMLPERALKILQEINEMDRRVKEAGYTDEELKILEAGLRDLIRKRRG